MRLLVLFSHEIYIFESTEFHPYLGEIGEEGEMFSFHLNTIATTQLLNFTYKAEASANRKLMWARSI